MLLAVPNFSEGRERETIDRLAEAVQVAGVELWDAHSDGDHNRTVLTLAGGTKPSTRETKPLAGETKPSIDEAKAPAGEMGLATGKTGPPAVDAKPPAGEARPLAEALLAGAKTAIELIDMGLHSGEHPCIGALDVAPIAYLDEADRQVALETARVVARRIGESLEVPVFLYGELASDAPRRERSFFRRGGVAEIARRLKEGEITPDFGPSKMHPTAGATLVGARPPLVAFNVELTTDDVSLAKAIADKVREDGGGLRGVRAVGLLAAGQGCAQVSTNVESPLSTPLVEVVDAVRREAEGRGAGIDRVEVVGLLPEAALAGFPSDLEIRGFDPGRQVLERRLGGA